MACIAAAVGTALLLAGCATTRETVGGWFGKETPASSPAAAPHPASKAQAPTVYYAGVEGMKVYSEASAASKVIGTLSLHEKITRTGLERGYAYVQSSKTGIKGWVDNARLIWRLPGAAETAAPRGEGAQEPARAPEEVQPQEPSTPAQEAEEAQPQEPTAPTVEEPQAPETTAPAAEPPPTATPVPAAPAKAGTTPGGVRPSIFNPY